MNGRRWETNNSGWLHPQMARRTAIQVGSIGILGLGSNHLVGLQQAKAVESQTDGFGKAKSCIFIFLSGGLAQHESFDLKPLAPEEIRGEFRPIATRTPGIEICEHLPLLAERSHLWALCRSLTHSSNDHSLGHHIMLTGRSETPSGFQPNAPSPTDYPSLVAVAQRQLQSRNNLPPAVVIPERLVHSTGRVIPGQSAGQMGSQHEPWFIEAASFHNSSYGAFPEYSFDHQQRGHVDPRVFQAPHLALPHGLGLREVNGRLELLSLLQRQRQQLDHMASTQQFDRLRQAAVSLLTDRQLHEAFEVTQADPATQERYGANAFGWSLLMARRLVEAGIQLVQVNLGNNETWDTHGNAFPHLKDRLLPPLDRSLSALLDDLHHSGQLDETLIVMAGEFGRTPRITLLDKHYKLPGRDHWGAVQSVWMAGGGVCGGRVVGASDAHGGYPTDQPEKPENFAATIYHALGIPANATWHDSQQRPHAVYYGQPIAGLT
ncbi:MAG: DUF1501 domain-containing protein [Pirellulaceae bacterium]|nr:DUF1501 domain-containing protein [Pirellulaceae bacterium]